MRYLKKHLKIVKINFPIACDTIVMDETQPELLAGALRMAALRNLQADLAHRALRQRIIARHFASELAPSTVN